MTTVLLVRHAELALQGEILAGRSDAVSLSAKGRQQVRLLAEVLGREPVTAVHSSPRQRARQTAEAIAARHVLSVEVQPALDELDYGTWTGLSFEELEGTARWRAWNDVRATTSPPDGESMEALQARVSGHVAEVGRTYPGKTVVLVSHAEPIRAILLSAANLSFNDFARIEVLPGSITRLRLGPRATSTCHFREALAG